MRRSLAGRRLLLTRPVAASLRWARALEARGAETVVLPCVRVEPLDDAADRARLTAALGTADWIAFSSSRTVRLVARVARPRAGPPLRVAVVGPSTAAAARALLGRVDLVAPRPSGASLGAALAAVAGRGSRVLVVGTLGGLTAAERRLEAAGADWERVDVCETRPAPPGPKRHNLASLGVDTVLVASPSAVTGLSRRAILAPGTRIAAIGPTTARAVREAGLGEPAVAASPDLKGIVEVL